MLTILVFQTVHTVPLRQRFFVHLHSPAPSYLVKAYVLLMPAALGAACLFLAGEAWGHRQFLWGKFPRPNWPGMVFLALGYGVVLFLDYLLFGVLFPGMKAPAPMFEDFVKVYPVYLAAGLFSTWISGLAWQHEQDTARVAQAKSALMEARTRLVVAQLDPHNVLNVMANVGSMIPQDPAKASAMLDSAGYYLRRLLDSTKAPHIALWQERQIIEDYLCVEGIRLADRLIVDWDWPEAFEDMQLPPILVQPLVENAIKHGIWPCRAGGALRIKVAQAGQYLVLEVRNSGRPLGPVSRNGTGLENLRQRLAHEYGSAAHFDLCSDGPWTVATITIPLVPPCVS